MYLGILQMKKFKISKPVLVFFGTILMVLGSWIVSLTVRSTDLTDVGQGLGISSELHFSKKKKNLKKQTKTLCRRGTSPL